MRQCLNSLCKLKAQPIYKVSSKKNRVNQEPGELMTYDLFVHAVIFIHRDDKYQEGESDGDLIIRILSQVHHSTIVLFRLHPCFE